VSLDEYDSRPRAFWSYVVSALRQAGAAVSGTAAGLGRGEPVGHVFLLRLASALATEESPVILVLDDLHSVTDPVTLAGLSWVLHNAKTGLRLVAASRIDPMLPLHSYRLAGELTEIRAQTLAFTPSEANLLMRQHGVTLPADSVEGVTLREEGWAAGLRLAAMSMNRHPDPELFAKSLVAEDSAVAGYLVEEVLNTQPPAVRELLLCTSILDRVGEDIAADLLGDAEAGAALPMLARSNAFVVALGRGWYRYHTLFRDVLRLKLRREHPGRAAELHARAAHWYAQAGALPEALRHAGEAGDGELAACILIDSLGAVQLLDHEGSDLPVSALRHAPESTSLPQPLLAAAALALAAGRLDACGELLSSAGDVLASLASDQELPSRFTAAVLALEHARRAGNLEVVTASAALASLLLKDLPGDLRPAAAAQAAICRAAGQFWSGDLDAAARTLGQAAALPEADMTAGPAAAHLLTRCSEDLALVEALRGRLGAAEGTAAKHAPAAGAGAAAMSVARALVHLERNELNGVRAQLKAAEAQLRARPDKLVGAVGCLVAARASLAEGRALTALEIIGRGRASWPPPPWLDRLLSVAESQACTAAGDTKAAVRAASAAAPQSSLDARAALARAQLAAGDLRAARHTLRGAGEIPASKLPDRVGVEALLADALISIRSDDAARGRRSLEQALRAGERERLRLPFAIERSWLLPALRQHADLAHSYRHLLESGLVPRGWVAVQQRAAGAAPPVIVERLSDREREVLRRVGEMLTTEEIAAELYISVNTVKSHLKTIFRKLGASDRRQAVRHAKELKVI
jgi:LuxR family maltose regulon positive regulatory protein